MLLQQCSETWLGHLSSGIPPAFLLSQSKQRLLRKPTLLLSFSVKCPASFPPTLPALQHRCSSTTSSCPILLSVSCKNQHLCKAFYRCSQAALFLPCLAEHSHPILPSVSCPQPQQRSTEPMFGDFSRRYAAFTMMLSPALSLPQQLICFSSPPWSGNQDHQNFKAF